MLAAGKACAPFDVYLLFADIALCKTEPPSNEEAAVGNTPELQVRARLKTQVAAAAVEHIQ